MLGCSPTFLDQRNSEKKDGGKSEDSGEETETEPTGVSGTNLLDFANSRVRCHYVDGKRNEYEIVCDAAVIDENGSESIATGIKDGVVLVWGRPEKISGATIESLKCSETNQKLQFACKIKLASSETTKVSVKLDVRAQKRRKVEADTIVLPYSVSSYGLVLQIPRLYKTADEQPLDEKIQKPVGFQSIAINPFRDVFGGISSFCQIGSTIYFAAHDFIYSYHDGKVKIFAGNANVENVDEFSHRLRVHLKSDLELACDEARNYIYVGDSIQDRIIRLHQTDPAVLIVGAKNGIQGEGVVAAKASLSGGITGLTVAPSGEIYYSEFLRHRVRKINLSGIVTTYAGSEVDGFDGDSGPAISAKLNSPGQLAVDADGSLLIVDTNNSRIRKVDATGKISTVAGNGGSLGALNGQAAHMVGIGTPQSVATAADGSYYLASGNHILKVDKFGFITKIAGDMQDGLSAERTPMARMKFKWLSNVMLSKDGMIYFLDQANPSIQMFDSEGRLKTIVGQNYGGGSPTYGIIAEQDAVFASVRGVAIDKDGSILFAHSGRATIERLDHEGKLSVIAGMRDQGEFYGEGVAAALSRLKVPQSLSLQNDGSIIFADTFNDRIRKINPDGIIETIAGSGISGNLGDGLNALNSQLDKPSGIAVGPDGKIYIADTQNHRVRVIGSDGKISAVAGTGEGEFDGDGGPALEAKLRYPEAIALDSDGNIYIADLGNNKIRKIYKNSGLIQTIAGYVGDWANMPETFEDRATAILTRLNLPSDIIITGSGKIYIADSGSSRIRILEKVSGDGINEVYKTNTIIGGSAVQDCGSGLIQNGKARVEDVDSKIKASLSVMCVGNPQKIAVREDCARADGKITIAFSQNFFANRPSSNIIKIVRPCR